MTLSPQKRIQNEATFRELNQRIKQNVSRMMAKEDKDNFDVKFICECSNMQCVDNVEITVHEYEEIHNSPAQFIIKKGHEQKDIESIHLKGKRYLVVDKHVAPAN